METAARDLYQSPEGHPARRARGTRRERFVTNTPAMQTAGRSCSRSWKTSRRRHGRLWSARNGPARIQSARRPADRHPAELKHRTPKAVRARHRDVPAAVEYRSSPHPKKHRDEYRPRHPRHQIRFRAGLRPHRMLMAPKGSGSENMSFLKMLNPAEGSKGIQRFVLQCIFESGARPCPPMIVGIGLGGTSDVAMHWRKRPAPSGASAR